MSTDPFEKQLQGQAPRQVPAGWREDILRAARAGAAGAPALDRGVLVRVGLKVWRELFWPCRHAWTGLVALWLILGAINARLSTSPSSVTLTRSTPAPAIYEAMEERRQVLAELIPSPRSFMTEPPRRSPAPRSERRALRLCA